MTAIYHAYAPFYDGSGQLRFAVLMERYLGELLQRHTIPGSRVLDVACGTGTLAIMFADRGYDVLGVDASEAMLAIAENKAAAMETLGRVRFVQGDMRDFAHVVEGPFDLVTCTYDSVNYLLSEAEIAQCFANAAQVLAPNGMFMFDMNTRHFLEHDWEPVLVFDAPDFVQIAQSYFDPTNDCSTMVLTGFYGDDTEGYQRFEEVHVERAYPPETIETLLKQAGLGVEAAYDCFTLLPHYETSQRIAWLARKHG